MTGYFCRSVYIGKRSFNEVKKIKQNKAIMCATLKVNYMQRSSKVNIAISININLTDVHSMHK